jgi:hypothetical protein
MGKVQDKLIEQKKKGGTVIGKKKLYMVNLNSARKRKKRE